MVDEWLVSESVFIFGGVAWYDPMPHRHHNGWDDEVKFVFTAKPVRADLEVDMARVANTKDQPFKYRGHTLAADEFTLDADICEDSRCPMWVPKPRPPRTALGRIMREPFDTFGANPHYHYTINLIASAIPEPDDWPPLAITEGASS